MSKVRTIVWLLAVIALATSLCTVIYAQQTPIAPVNERERGIQLFQQGDIPGAITALQSFVKSQKNDVRAWHNLGLALEREGNRNDARKAHEKAAKFAYERITSAAQQTNLERLSFVIAELKPLLMDAAKSAEKYLELSSKPSKSKVAEWRERARMLRDLGGLEGQPVDLNAERTIFTTQEVTTKARILAKAFPEYTDEARKNNVAGKVILLLVLGADGNVGGFIPLVKLPYGLTEASINAARRIKFIPATKDGKPVSVFMKVEYNFNIYFNIY